MVIGDNPVLDPEVPPQAQEDDAVELSCVKRWLKRKTAALARWDKDFKRMRKNMEFVYGLQYEGQISIDEEVRYVANLTLQLLRQKTAQLYARNPTFEAVRKPKMDFEIWDGEIESLTEAFQSVMMSRQSAIAGMPTVPDMQAEALMQDFMSGRQLQAMMDKLCRTLKLVSQHQIDSHKPDFKKQMKQLVRRIIICGVGYVRPTFIREGSSELSTTEARHAIVDRLKMAKNIIGRVAEDEISEEDAEIETLRSLLLSVGLGGDAVPDTELSERVEFDFLPATSVIPDERCRQLEEFVAARWLFVQYPMTVEDINSAFALEGDRQVKLGGSASEGYNIQPETHSSENLHVEADDADPARAGKILVYEVIDFVTKTHCFIAEGHKYYLKAPTPFDIQVTGFWPLVAVTFNGTEREEDTKTSIFPPSDIDLVKTAQQEWNRSRDALRDQRNANAPTYLTRKGVLSKNDKDALKNREPNEVIELEGVPPDMKIDQVVSVLQVARIDPAVYTTQHLEQDMMLAAGMQQANLGPAQPDVTATVGTIAEQSRLTVTSSNVDDLDGGLSSLAQMVGELLIQGMGEQTVKRIAGRGAVWPTLGKEDFLNEVNLTVIGASSGRPNKAIEVANFERVAPFLLQAGANPFAIIKEGVRRMGDEQLDVDSFLPLPGSLQPPSPQGGPPNGQRPAQKQKPTQAPMNQGQGQMMPQGMSMGA